MQSTSASEFKGCGFLIFYPPYQFILSRAPIKLNKIIVRYLISSVVFTLIICPLPWSSNSLPSTVLARFRSATIDS